MSASDEKVWQTTAAQNLVRYAPSGTYFARFCVGGKLVWKSSKKRNAFGRETLPNVEARSLREYELKI
jgi:hypothetical protein